LFVTQFLLSLRYCLEFTVSLWEVIFLLVFLSVLRARLWVMEVEEEMEDMDVDMIQGEDLATNIRIHDIVFIVG